MKEEEFIIIKVGHHNIYTLVWWFTVYVVYSDFPAVFTCKRSDTFFFVVQKFLAIVASRWFWHIYFNFSYCVPYFYFSKRMLKLRIYMIVWLFFLMDIRWALVTPCLQRFVFISSRMQKKTSGFLTTPFDEFREL